MSKKPKSFILNNEQYKLLIPGYPEGSDITVLNTSYVPRKKVEDEEGNTKYEKDYIFISFRDNKKEKKKTYIIYEPLYTFYKLNDDIIPTDYVLFFIPKEYVTPYTCKYSNILQAIAEVTKYLIIYIIFIIIHHISDFCYSLQNIRVFTSIWCYIFFRYKE